MQSLSARNNPDRSKRRITANSINVYDILKYDTVVVDKERCRSNRGGVRIMADLKYYDIISKPVITEKSMAGMELKKYTFYVHTEATKSQIKEAVEKMFARNKGSESQHNELLKVRNRRRGMAAGKTAKRKKAIVQLTEDSADIEIFEGL